MKELNKKYSVFNSSGDLWGEVELKWDKYEKLHGYLKEAESFSKVAPLFERYEELTGETSGNNSELALKAKQIANLGVVLKSKDGPAIEAGVVFVSKTKKGLLFSCSK